MEWIFHSRPAINFLGASVRITGNRINGPLVRRLSAIPHHANRPTKKYSRAALIMCTLAGIILGIWIHSGLTSPPVVVHDTITTKPAPTETVTKKISVPVPTVPEDCQMAIEIITQMQPDIKTIDSAGETETDIISNAHVAIGERDPKALSSIGTDQNNLNNKISEARRRLNDNMTDLNQVLDSCQEILAGATPFRTGG